MQSIGLALSGGGVRAVAFHAGVLRYLAEQGWLERVVHVSSVSGGSLFTGLVYKSAGYSWPTSQSYLSTTLPQIQDALTHRSLLLSVFSRLLLDPRNWKHILSRANVLSQAIRELWGIGATLDELKNSPQWSINGTTAETGRRFRFRAGTLGDYELGYADAGAFPLSAAMAISAAFPGGFGPLTIHSREYEWRKRENWDAAADAPHEVPFGRLHIYDGGLYDNLGIEPLFDVGKQSPKHRVPDKIESIVVADAGLLLARSTIPHPMNPLRFKRIADIALDQTRALRVRSFVNFVKGNPDKGAYIGIGNPAEPSIDRWGTGREPAALRLRARPWLAPADAKRAAAYPTTIRRMQCADFDLIARHGYETTKWNIELFLSIA